MSVYSPLKYDWCGGVRLSSRRLCWMSFVGKQLPDAAPTNHGCRMLWCISGCCCHSSTQVPSHISLLGLMRFLCEQHAGQTCRPDVFGAAAALWPAAVLFCAAATVSHRHVSANQCMKYCLMCRGSHFLDCGRCLGQCMRLVIMCGLGVCVMGLGARMYLHVCPAPCFVMRADCASTCI